jgi:hypothetical protein
MSQPIRRVVAMCEQLFEEAVDDEQVFVLNGG